ncbi:MAG: Flp family type IVb pilin [Acidimicrobiia bacterium]
MNLDILKTWIQAKFNTDERGASMVEYGLLLALIAVVAIVALQFVGGEVKNNFNSVGSSL